MPRRIDSARVRQNRRSPWPMAGLGLLVTVASIACGGTYQSYPPPAPPPQPAPERAGPPPEPPPTASSEEDPPGRVGRISYLQGVVSFRAAEADDWGPAVPNRPVTSGDRFWTDADGRAEVDVGSAMLRMAPQTEADVVRLDDGSVQMRLPQGTLTERVRDLPDGQVDEIDAPSASVSVSQPGEYRVDVSADGATTRVTVWSGRALVSASGSSFDVNAHQVATVQEGNPPTYDLVDAGGPDEFDQWVVNRDATRDRAVRSRAYVSADMPGASDLDEYGSWQDDPGVGPVWYPTAVEPGWAPYRTGHWVWVQRWGWTWVDDAPWGYAPYHYGRWAQVGGRWGWCPGRTVAPPVYAPALVVFVGGRPGPAPQQQVAWFPLAPGEAYQPAYPTSVGYRQRINVTTVKNVTNITNVTNTTTVTNVTNVTNVTYQNRTVANAVTVVPQQTFVGAQPVARAAVPMAPRDVASATVVGAAPRVAPTRASLLVAGVVGARAPVAPPPTVSARAVVATHEAPPTPVPFSAQEHALATNAGRPLAPSQVLALHAAPAPRTDVVALRPSAPAAVKVTSGAAGRPAAAAPGAQPPPPPPAIVAHPPTAQPSPSPAAVTPPVGAKPAVIEPRLAAPPPPSSPQPGRVLVGDTAGKAKPGVARPPIGQPPTESPSGTQVTQPLPPAKPAQPPPRPATPPPVAPATPPTPPTPPAATRPLAHPPVATPADAPGTEHSTLDESYATERAALDARHRDELAHPKPGETPDALTKRHDAERRALDAKYQKARSAGVKTLPPLNPDAKRPN